MLRTLNHTFILFLGINTLTATHVFGETDGGAIPPVSIQKIEQIEQSAKKRHLDALGRVDVNNPRVSVGDLNIPTITEMAREFPLLADMLNLGSTLEEIDQVEEKKSISEKGVVLVSFSMPDETLRQISEQADHYGFTTVYRGLVNNSFPDTLDKLVEVFGSELSGLSGLSINPTVYNRFGVEVVPAFIFLKDVLKPCLKQGCEGEDTPEHDIVYGNIGFKDAAQIVINNSGVGALTAQEILNGVVK